MGFIYNVSGIVLHSSFPLEYFIPLREKKLPNISIQIGKAIKLSSEKIIKELSLKNSSYIHLGEYDMFMYINDLAYFSITNRRLIIIEPIGNTTDEEALPFFYGTVLTVLFTMHYTYPLHASAVYTSNGINLFCAQSGTGKSTLAFNLHQRGYSLFSDDKCILKWDKIFKRYISEPSIRAVRLWQDTIDDSYEKEALKNGKRVISKEDKYQFNLNKEMYNKVQFVNQIFIIRKTKEIREIKIRRLKLNESIIAIKNNVHKPALIVGEKTIERYNQFCANVARLIPVHFVRRPENIPIQKFVDFMETKINI